MDLLTNDLINISIDSNKNKILGKSVPGSFVQIVDESEEEETSDEIGKDSEIKQIIS